MTEEACVSIKADQSWKVAAGDAGIVAGQPCEVRAGLGEGGTRVIGDVLTPAFADRALAALLPDGVEGVRYGQHFARTADGSLRPLPRQMAFQATPADEGATPWYRCTMAQVPENVSKMDYAPWTPTLEAIKAAAEAAAGCTWNLAHIICYRNEKDSMGFHRDTFLDFRPGSSIGVVSLGAEREVVMRRKRETGQRDADVHHIDLTHNTLMLLDEETNAKWTHGVQKKRQNQVEGARVAIVFRERTTYRSSDGHIFGPRCEHQTFAEALAAEVEECASPELAAVKQEKRAKATERIHRMCELKNIKEWDGEGMAAFLRGEE